MNSYYIDTNVFARLILGDIPQQYFKASEFFQKIEKSEIEGRLSVLVVNELVWILERYYNMDREEYVSKILSLIQLKGIKVVEIDKNLLTDVLEKFSKHKFDLTDIYLSKIAKKEKIFSFDKDFAKIAKL